MKTMIVLLAVLPRTYSGLVPGAVKEAEVTGNLAVIEITPGDRITAKTGQWRPATPKEVSGEVRPPEWVEDEAAESVEEPVAGTETKTDDPDGAKTPEPGNVVNIKQDDGTPAPSVPAEELNKAPTLDETQDPNPADKPEVPADNGAPEFNGDKEAAKEHDKEPQDNADFDADEANRGNQ